MVWRRRPPTATCVRSRGRSGVQNDVVLAHLSAIRRYRRHLLGPEEVAFSLGWTSNRCRSATEGASF